MPEPKIEQEPKEKIRKIIVMPKESDDNITAEIEKNQPSFPQGTKPYELPYSRGRFSSSTDFQSTDSPSAKTASDLIENKEKPIEKAPKELTEKPAEIIDAESGYLDIKKAKMSNVKIADLREIHKQNIHITKQEKITETKKIEEKQKLIEARKEEIRLIKEKQSKQLDEKLGGIELLKKG